MALHCPHERAQLKIKHAAQVGAQVSQCQISSSRPASTHRTVLSWPLLMTCSSVTATLKTMPVCPVSVLLSWPESSSHRLRKWELERVIEALTSQLLLHTTPFHSQHGSVPGARGDPSEIRSHCHTLDAASVPRQGPLELARLKDPHAAQIV